MKVLVVVSGGGHFAPALALVEALKHKGDVLLVGRKYALEGDSALSLEYSIAKSRGIPFHPITTGRLQRKITQHTLSSLLKTPQGIVEAITIVRQYGPDVVVSFGGYVSLPIALAAFFLGVPLVIHEQTFGGGAANKIAARFAKKICISWESSRKFFPSQKVILTGNPIRSSILHPTQSSLSLPKASVPTLCIIGGSLGSHAINQLVEGCLEQLLAAYVVVHQTGDAQEFKDFERLSEKASHLSEKLAKRYVLTKFIDEKEVGAVIKQSDLVIARAGMGTVTELLYLGTPALLIPLPISQRGEQVENALFLQQTGLGEMVLQKDLTPKLLFDTITRMMHTLKSYRSHAAGARMLVRPDSVNALMDIVSSLVRK